MTAGDAWYEADRASFLEDGDDEVVAVLADSATRLGWHVEQEQHEEWSASVQALQGGHPDHRKRVEIVRKALRAPDLEAFSHVVLEYDFRRRGLRIDCVLLAPGVIVVLEFKRTKLTAADRDQVAHYCISLLEFHERTRLLCDKQDVIVVPILALTQGRREARSPTDAPFHNKPWAAVLKHPLECDSHDLTEALRTALALRRSRAPVEFASWLKSRFSPSSTILDAAISLFGHHKVSAIESHATPARAIGDCTREVEEHIQEAKRTRRNRIIIVSGAPGAGKTLVGLRIAFSPKFREDAVFVTGNAPLVDVLTRALKDAYAGPSHRRRLVASGYAHEDIHHVIRNATFKIVKAHQFLGERGKKTASSDGSIVIFDEAQRTYEKGRLVAGHKLPDHEADLILASLETSYAPGACVVALVGHHQAINAGERGAVAWFEAATRRGWDFAIGDDTLALSELSDGQDWSRSPLRKLLRKGHLAHSMRFYRNKEIEAWTHAVLEEDAYAATALAHGLEQQKHTLWLTRELGTAKRWARAQRVGEDRIGLIGSAQGRRLAAEGLFVGIKPPIAHWMLAPTGDIRSSNMLETVQNQYQVQGLELDYTIVCWDTDLRRTNDAWSAHKLRGANWQRDKRLDVAKNGYRVLLTRARKGMVIFVPSGDTFGEDATRSPETYDGVAKYLMRCGARTLGCDRAAKVHGPG